MFFVLVETLNNKYLLMDKKKKIEVMKLYLIFGRERNRAFKMLMKGKSKQEIKKETGCTVAVNGANFAINEGEIFVIMGLSGSGNHCYV